MADLSAPGDRSPRISWGPRLLAPLALVLALIAVFVVVTGSMSIDDDDSPNAAAKVEEKSGQEDKEGPENPKTYVVESGDLYSTIAEKFGVSVERLERLNPDVDPQTLQAGAELTIR